MKKQIKPFNNLVDALALLPSIGRKSALRMASHMILEDNFSATKIAHAIEDAIANLKECTVCNGLSEDEICHICIDEDRDPTMLCIVEHPKDILRFEENEIYKGKYLVLNLAKEINIKQIQDNIEKNNVKEIIFALTPCIATDAIIIQIEDKLKDINLKFTRIAQGIPTGVSIENIDLISLTKAIKDRVNI